MSRAAITTTNISPRDRLAFMMFLSLALNMMVILGISFDFSDLIQEETPLPTLDIILVEQNDSEASDDADFLSQFNQTGAGNTQEVSRPSTLESATPVPVSGESEYIQEEQTTEQESSAIDQELLTRHDSDEQVFSDEEIKPNPTDTPMSAAMILRGREIARLSAEISLSMEGYSKRTKHRYISASTKSFRDAAYLDDWRRKIERVGNLNYPEEARSRNLSGSLIMDVAINPNGTINTISIRRSSGQKVLDDAATRIVRLAAPFSPLPQAMRKDTDVLHITRTWQFLSGNRLSTSNR